MARPRTAFDGGCMQAVDRKLIAHLFQQAQLGFVDLPIRRGNITGERIGRFIEIFGQVILNQTEQRRSPSSCSNRS